MFLLRCFLVFCTKLGAWYCDKQAVIALGARVTVDGTFNPLYLVEKKVKIFLDALLSELEKEALVKLAVFGGSFSSTGMEYVNEVGFVVCAGTYCVLSSLGFFIIGVLYNRVRSLQLLS